MLQKHRAGNRRKSKSRFLSCESLESRQLLAVVMNLNDDGSADSLRGCIDSWSSGDPPITFMPGLMGPITLTMGELVVDDAITIDASGANIAISGGGASRVMRIDDSNDSNFVNVTLKGDSANNLVIENGLSVTDGAGIQSFENLTLDYVTVRNNTVTGAPGDYGQDAGGIAQGGETRPGGDLTILNSTIESNTSVDDAAALDHYNSNDLTIRDTTIRSNVSGGVTADANQAGYVGPIRIIDAVTAALYGDQDIVFDNLTFTDNETRVVADGDTADPAALGGILVSAQAGQSWTMDVRDSTFTGNFHDVEADPANGIYGDGRAGALYITDVTELSISDSTFTGNYSYGPAGALQVANSDVDVTATLSNLTIRDNGDGADFGFTGQSSSAGGLWVISFNSDVTRTDLTLNDSVIEDNFATFGGGITIQQGVDVTINNSTISGNSAASRGGGIYNNNFNGTNRLTLDQTTVDSNQADLSGGGINIGSAYNTPYGNYLTVQDSTISRNNVVGDATYGYGKGGGIYSTQASISIVQSTIADNTAYYGGGALHGEYYTQSVSISRSTITGNTANTAGAPGMASGGGLSLPLSYAAPHTVDNSIVAQNVDVAVAGDADIGGPGANVDVSYSFLGTSSSSSATITDLSGSPPNMLDGGDPMLVALGKNGGPTETRPPMAGSPVIDAGSGTRAMDQRQMLGVYGPAVDMGSVELGLDLDFSGDGMYDCDDMDLLEAQIDSTVYNAAFDVNDDGVLDSNDVYAWLNDAGQLRFNNGNIFIAGDANLDGKVDGSDFGIWNANVFQTPRTNWCQADFNQDDVVDGSDFGIWNTNKFSTSLAARPSGGSVNFAAVDRRGAVRTQFMTPMGREVAARVPQAAPTAVRAQVRAVPAIQLAAVGSQDQLRSQETARTSAIERVFADLESDELSL